MQGVNDAALANLRRTFPPDHIRAGGRAGTFSRKSADCPPAPGKRGVQGSDASSPEASSTISRSTSPRPRIRRAQISRLTNPGANWLSFPERAPAASRVGRASARGRLSSRRRGSDSCSSCRRWCRGYGPGAGFRPRAGGAVPAAAEVVEKPAHVGRGRRRRIGRSRMHAAVVVAAAGGPLPPWLRAGRFDPVALGHSGDQRRREVVEHGLQQARPRGPRLPLIDSNRLNINSSFSTCSIVKRLFTRNNGWLTAANIFSSMRQRCRS